MRNKKKIKGNKVKKIKETTLELSDSHYLATRGEMTDFWEV